MSHIDERLLLMPRAVTEDLLRQINQMTPLTTIVEAKMPSGDGGFFMVLPPDAPSEQVESMRSFFGDLQQQLNDKYRKL